MNLDGISQNYLGLFPGDFSGNTRQRQTPEVLFATVEPALFPDAELLAFNEKLSAEIGLGTLETQEDRDFINAAAMPPSVKTYATAYAGHQFGNWAGQLGDGRALFAGEITNSLGQKTELQWKGAGATPYSRHADGRAVLRSSVREYLMSEAMHHLGIPTTRALSLSLTGEMIVRDIMYDGHPNYEKGAVMMRTAPSFLRFGHFELPAAQNNLDLLQKLADFAITEYFPEITTTGPDRYAAFFSTVAARTAALMVEWYRVGFVHGVMNTDNMSILGLTIDYGPFSFLDEYSLNFTPNTTDLPGRRYAFGNQAKIAQWNLWQLANALFPLVKDEKLLEDVLNDFTAGFWKQHDEMMARKFGFEAVLPDDGAFFMDAQHILEALEADHTLFFSHLEALEADSDVLQHFSQIFYSGPTAEKREKFSGFIKKYRERQLKSNLTMDERKQIMQKVNPKFILRNYLLFECIEELTAGDKTMLNKLWQALQDPYRELFPEFSKKRPSKYDGQVGCSTLSCSS